MNTGKRLLSFVLALTMALSLLPMGAMAKGLTSGEVSILDHGDSTTRATDTWYYDDVWFTQSSYQENAHLATLSSLASSSASAGQGDMTGQSAIALLEELGFLDTEENAYFARHLTLPDSIGCILGHKTITEGRDTYTLLAVLPRSGGYGSEWAGDFNVGESGIHQGFLLARDEILRFMRQYVEEYAITGPLKIWISGYSRSAGVADLLGGFLADDGGAYLGEGCTVDPEDLYVYSMATPATIPAQDLPLSDALSVSAAREGLYEADTPGEARPSDREGTVVPGSEQYGGIHNYVAIGDIVTKLPPEEIWELSRYGTVETIDQAEGLPWLSEQNPDLRVDFPEGGYGVPLPYMTLDLSALSIVPDLNREGISLDALTDSRVVHLAQASGSRSGYVQSGLDVVLGNLLTALDADLPSYEALVEAVGGTGTLIEAGVLNVLAMAVEELQAEDPELTEDQALAIVASQILTYLSGQEVDPAACSAADALNLLLSLLLTSEDGEDPLLKTIAAMISGETGALLTEFADWFALQERDIPADPDAILACLAAFLVDNKETPAVQALVSDLAEMLMESGYGEMVVALFALYEEGRVLEDLTGQEQVEAALWIMITGCVSGIVALDDPEYPLSVEERTMPAEELRSFVKMLILPTLLPDDAVNLKRYIRMWDFAQKPNTLGPLVRELVGLILLPEGAESVVAGADQVLADLAGRVATVSAVPACWLTLAQSPAMVRHALASVLFAPRETFSFVDELEDGLTVVTYASALILCHYNESYIAWFKSQDSLYSQFDRSDGKGGGGGQTPAPTPTPEPEANCPLDDFRDLNRDAWYHDGLHFCLAEGVMKGYEDGTFRPNASTTRAELVTMLWNLEGSPAAPDGPSFTDVTEGSWYAEPVRWAAANGITQGTGDGKFSPNAPVTREQLAKLFQGCAASKGRAADAAADLSAFTDRAQVSDWAVPAMEWAVATGLITGRTKTLLAPQENATRAEAGTILSRFVQGD